jgi:hypothetical protein
MTLGAEKWSRPLSADHDLNSQVQSNRCSNENISNPFHNSSKVTVFQFLKTARLKGTE